MYRRLQKTVLFPIGRDSLFYCFFFLDIVYYLYIVCINGLCDFSQSLFFMLRFNRVVNIDKNPLRWKY